MIDRASKGGGPGGAEWGGGAPDETGAVLRIEAGRDRCLGYLAVVDSGRGTSPFVDPYSPSISSNLHANRLPKMAVSAVGGAHDGWWQACAA